MKKKIRIITGVLSCIAFAVFLMLFTVFIVSAAMQSKAKNSIYSVTDMDIPDKDYDAIVVLGAGVRDDGSPSDMLYDRIYCAYEIYKAGICDKIIMSGDRTGDYDEPGVMKKTAIELGVDEEHIILDEKGFSTYETVTRAKEVFGVKKAIFVTQEYHLGRTLFIARSVGIDALGVGADYRTYIGQTYRDLREAVARFKDFLVVTAK